MRVEDVDGPVVAAATRTPFEARRRVFVLERVDTMNDEVANRLLKTLEEPAHFVHLILLTDALGRVLETVVSRCQLVRFDPLPAERIAAELEADGVPAERARACARLALGNAERAPLPRLRGGRGAARRGRARSCAAALGGRAAGAAGGRCSSAPRSGRGRGRGGVAAEARAAARARAEGPRARRARARARGGRQARGPPRAHRGARPGADAGGARVPRPRLPGRGRRRRGAGRATARALAGDARARDPRRLREAAERCEDVRLSLELNVTEDLALSALGLRLAALAGAP